MKRLLTIEHLENIVSDDKLALILERNFKHIKVGQKSKMKIYGADGIEHTIYFSRSK